MTFEKGEKIGATVYGKVYVGTINHVSNFFYYIDIEGDKNGFALCRSIDNVKPVCKSSNIVYARSDH